MTLPLPRLPGRWIASLRSSPRVGRTALVYGAAAGILMASAIAIGALAYSYNEAQLQAAATTRSLATSMELTIEGLLDSTDVELRATADELSRRFSSGRFDGRSIAQYLERQAVRLPYLASMRAYDEDGARIAAPAGASPLDTVSDRGYFVRARDGADNGLLVGRVSRDPANRQWSWPLARRLNDVDGSFDGILLAGMRLDTLKAMFKRIRLERGDSIELRDSAMGLVARTVFQESDPIETGDARTSVEGLETMSLNPTEGTFVGGTYADPVDRTYSYRRSPKYGFVVVVGLSRETALAQWRKQAAITLALLGSFISSALAFCWIVNGGLRRQEDALDRIRTSEHALSEAMEIARLGSFVYDLREDSWTSSEAFDQMFGIDDEHPRDLVHWLKLVDAESRPEVRTLVNRLIEKGTPFDLEYRIVRPIDGQARWVHCACRLRQDKLGNPKKIVGTYQDITERKSAEETINKLAFFDQLTGLANRTLLLDRLRQAMSRTDRSGHTGAVLLIDLDNFKALNDIHGHEKGDLLLKQVAQRLNACLRGEDTVARPVDRNTVARLGGDEFVVVLPNLSGAGVEESAAQAKVIASRILFALNQNYELDGISFVGTASIGVTLFRGDRASIEDVLKQADLAMYRAKASGRDAVCFFDADLERTVLKRAMLEAQLRRALDLRQSQFQLHYQAQVVGEGHVTGAEVLARWTHPELGTVSPTEFIPVAEESNLILPLGKWVLETACHQLAAWALIPEFMNLTLAVNVSAQQFYQTDFVDQVRAVLAVTKARPQLLKLELTESLLLRDVDEIIKKMMALKAIGVGFALDDFGTGYSSLVYLKRLPLDQLKIDKNFVRDVLVDTNDAAIARTVAALGQTLGLTVVAEGVETEAQRDFLKDSGCHAYQGYFISRPLPVEGFEDFARRAWERENVRFLSHRSAVAEDSALLSP
jgi:diguanylate cyclase (GGDEF)-like protein/PAS domain S-box-containing protein